MQPTKKITRLISNLVRHGYIFFVFIFLEEVLNLYSKLIDLGRKPSGLFGGLIGNLMNLGHRDAYIWGTEHFSIESNSIILDIGCGGGAAVRLLAAKAPEGKVYGIDHSLGMVNLSRKVNERLIKDGRVKIDHGSVSRLPYSEDMFDLITAFETIEFWPNLSSDLTEVQRVLKPHGIMLIVNRHSTAKEDNRWATLVQNHTNNGYRALLENAGFVGLTIDDFSKKGWITVFARNSYKK